MFDNIPDNLKWHFIRGYFDGDGTVGVYEGKARVGFVGRNKSLLEEINHFIQLYVKTSSKVRLDKNNFRLLYLGNHVVEEIFSFLYADSVLCMNRKHEIMKSVKANGGVGVYNSRAILKPGDVLEIRSSNLSLRQLAEKFGVSRSCISGVRKFRNWKS